MFKRFMPTVLALAMIASANAETEATELHNLEAEILADIAQPLSSEEVATAEALGLPNPETITTAEEAQDLIQAIQTIEKSLTPTEKAKAFLKKYKRQIIFTALGTAVVAGGFVAGAHYGIWPDAVMNKLPSWKWLVGQNEITKKEARLAFAQYEANKAKKQKLKKEIETITGKKGDAAALEEEVKGLESAIKAYETKINPQNNSNNVVKSEVEVLSEELENLENEMKNLGDETEENKETLANLNTQIEAKKEVLKKAQEEERLAAEKKAQEEERLAAEKKAQEEERLAAEKKAQEERKATLLNLINNAKGEEKQKLEKELEELNK